MSEPEIILTFHGVGEPRDEIDAGERPYWVGSDTYRRILDLVDEHPNGRVVTYTFDDGNSTDMPAAEALHARGRTGKFYVLTSRIDRPHYLSVADIHHLSELGMEVGLHGRDHVDWSLLDKASLNAETVEARSDLARAAARPVTSVAIPFGRYNRRVIRKLTDAGFDRIYTCDGGWAKRGQQVQNRTSIRADMGLDDVRAILDGYEPGSVRAKRLLKTALKRHVV
jgi:peptidoglycan/xylan/chitin deacetylase (PgdA/CDA1 family)